MEMASYISQIIESSVGARGGGATGSETGISHCCVLAAFLVWGLSQCAESQSLVPPTCCYQNQCWVPAQSSRLYQRADKIKEEISCLQKEPFLPLSPGEMENLDSGHFSLVITVLAAGCIPASHLTSLSPALSSALGLKGVLAAI